MAPNKVAAAIANDEDTPVARAGGDSETACLVSACLTDGLKRCNSGAAEVGACIGFVRMVSGS
jgi:hypothetical protein